MKKITACLFAMLALMLASFAAGVQYERGDVNQDGTVGISDVTCLIDYILTGTWEDEPVTPPDEHEYVDLGLPSGTLWATCNVGADTPEGYGDYFAWGETAPKEEEYSWATYKWCNGSSTKMTKYCTNSNYGTVDGKTELDPEDDAAYVNWGTSWRMPTMEQLEELWTECTWIWTTCNGVAGRLATGPNGNTMFLPAAGYRFFSSLNDEGSWGYIWSRDLCVTPYNAYGMCFASGEAGPGRSSTSRYDGQNVRPVRF